MHNIKIGHLHYRLTFHGHTHCFSFVETCLMHVLHLTHVRHGVVLYHNQIVKILACINVPRTVSQVKVPILIFIFPQK